jgi:outer membrane protein OmpA-like peptidoglycan-associated protein/tetratricopeptide (TPR) repeat protein
MNKTLIALFFALLSLSQSVSAQTEDLSRMKSTTLKNFAKNAERMSDTYTAIRFYTAYVEKRKEDWKTIYHLAQLEESTRNYAKAREYYSRAHEGKPDDFVDALYHKARMTKMLGDYYNARQEFQKFLALSKTEVDRDMRKEATAELAGCDTAAMLMTEPLPVVVRNMGTSVNQPHIEFSPIPITPDDIIFGSLEEKELKYYELDESRPKRKLYVAKRKGENWERTGELDGPFNSEEMHTVGGVYSPDGNRFYFTRCKEDWKQTVYCEIWMSKLAGEKWKQPVKLEGDINKEGYSSSQPTIGVDTKTGKDIIYFVSDRPDGAGGDDIWYFTYDRTKDTHSSPRNVGRTINTTRDEMSPFFFDKEKKLFYSTQGRFGLGGFDIFMTRGELKKWISPVNVGFPINSNADDIYYVLTENGNSGFLVSNRKGGQQILHETCCDDIYEWYKTNPTDISVELTAVEVENSEYLNGNSDDLPPGSASNDRLLENVGADVYLIENGGDVLIKSIETNQYGKISVDLEAEQQYRIELKKEGFLNNDVFINTMGVSGIYKISKVVGLTSSNAEQFVLKNIEYDFDSANLTSKAIAELDNVLIKILKENPFIKIELSSHTDSRGTTEYNNKLSQQRAESVVKYLTTNGIEKDRLIAKGYGERKPIAPNENADGSDNEEGRQKNRRTEFKIIGKIEPKKVEVSDED